jgi:hypothetical protein
VRATIDSHYFNHTGIAMPAIITTPLRAFNISQNRKAFSSIGAERVYLFIGKTDPWEDDELPPIPQDTTATMLAAHRDMVGLKFLEPVSMVTVCRRIDWEPNTIYDMYDDTISMTDGFSIESTSFPSFYVLTDEFNIYKCLSNNKGALSTVKPTGSSIAAFETADGYVWKYIYSLKSSDVFTFLTQDWMPVITLNTSDGSTQWTVQQNAMPGAIEHIEVESGGLGYSSSNVPTVIITGDGTGASAQAQVHPVTGEITKIQIVDVGQNYSYADVALDTGVEGGSGAALRAIMSPLGGHGSDPINELGGYFVMVASRIEGTEGGKIPDDIDFRQIGMIANPKSTDTGVRIGLTNVTGVFDNGDSIEGGTSGALAEVVSSNIDDRYIEVNVTSGAFLNGEIIETSSAQANVDYTEEVNLDLRSISADATDIVFGTGKILYLDNILPISRNLGQNEIIKFVIEG